MTAKAGTTTTIANTPTTTELRSGQLVCGQWYRLVRITEPVRFRPNAEREPQLGDTVYVLDTDAAATKCYNPARSAKQTIRPQLTHTAHVFVLIEGAERERLEAARRADWAKCLHLTGLDRGQSRYFQIGSDPEIFAVDERGTLVPAFKFLKDIASAKALGTAEPFWDGFQAEFNIGAATCHESTAYFIQLGLQAVYQRALALNPRAKLSWQSVLDLTPEMIEMDAKYLSFGCAPSLNIYGGEPLGHVDGRDIPFRFAGCHIHYGCGKLTEGQTAARVRAMDRIFGTVMTSLLAGLEDPRRRQFYGRAGEHRLPKHGLEYRVPSSTVLCHPIVMNICFDIARMAFYMSQFDGAAELWQMPGEDAQAQHILNDYDIDEARSILKLNDSLLSSMLTIIYQYGENVADDRKLAVIKRMITGGCKDMLPLGSMEENWHLLTAEQQKIVDDASDHGRVASIPHYRNSSQDLRVSNMRIRL